MKPSLLCVEDHSPNAADLCEAMFIEGARWLGFAIDIPIPVKAQEKILRAAISLVEELTTLLHVQNNLEQETEPGN